MSDTNWMQHNDEYLAAAIEWLRLLLAREADLVDAATQVSAPMAMLEATSRPARPVSVLVNSSPAMLTEGTDESNPGFFRRLFRRIFRRRRKLVLPVANEPGQADLPAIAPVPEVAVSRLPKRRRLPAEPRGEDDLVRAATALVAAAAVEPQPAILGLAQRLGLSPFERNLLLLCAAVELDTHIAQLCARAQGDPLRRSPTFALALSIFDDPAWDVLSPERPLRYWRLLEINQPDSQPLTVSALRADERIVNFIKGLSYLDDRLRPIVVPLSPAYPAELPPSQRDAVGSIVHRLAETDPDWRLPVVQLLGADQGSKQLVAAAATAALNLRAYRLPVELLPAGAAELDALARLWHRESILLPLALYLDAFDVAPESSEGRSSALARFLARVEGVVLVDTREPQPGLERDTLTLDIAKPTPLEQRATWTEILGPAAGDSPMILAGQFNLGVSEIRRIGAEARGAAGDDSAAVRERAWRLCLRASRPRLDSLAQRIDARAQWCDIVLPPMEEAVLRQIAAQVGQRGIVFEDWGFGRRMNRGKGISALFAGESGTGKTMAAEVLANDLQLDLYRIDLSQVVSKFIGETEKNLRRLFDAAEDGGVILFFDEADALFGKRSEVKDSHDRYANIEVNYLLQRMESFGGLAILATNMKSALDTAFMRRIRFVVNLPFPSATERKRIWEQIFPRANLALGLGGVPTEDLDYDHLAQLSLAGGSIQNIALNAAFMAAHEGAPVRMGHVLEAARGEFRKSERPMNEADFRWPPAGRSTAMLSRRA